MPQKQSMSDQVLYRLREDIVNCVYKPGEIITETEVAQRYGSSKTPAREALSTLCLEEYLQKFRYEFSCAAEKLGILQIDAVLCHADMEAHGFLCSGNRTL